MKLIWICILSISVFSCDAKDKADALVSSGTITILPPPGGLDALVESTGDTSLIADEFELKSLVFNLTELSIGEENDDAVTWQTVFEREAANAAAFDLLKGEGDSQLVSGVTPGTYQFIKLKFNSITYQRGENEECTSNTLTDEPGGGILTTQTEFESRGQTIDSVDSISPPNAGMGPSDLDSTVKDEYFWVLTSEVEVIEGANTSLIITALSDPIYTSAAPCNEAPGKPNFILGTSDSIISFYESLNAQ